MFRRRVAVIEDYHIRRSISTHTDMWVFMLVSYLGLPECGASAPKHVADFKIYIQFVIIQCVPLATEPSISLIILTPMKILQRYLNRSTFVV